MGQRPLMDRIVPDPFRRGGFTVSIEAASQSYVDPDDPLHLEFEYVQRIAELLSATVLERPFDERLRVVHLGGGGLTIPRWVEARRPRTAQIVCEPDSDLVAEVRAKLPLGRHSGIKIREVDGRTGLAAMPDDYADTVVLDAFAGLRVPGSLATSEAFRDARRVVRHEGIFVMNLADQAPFTWARSCIAGIRVSFGQAVVTGEIAVLKGRRYGNLVVAASATRLPVGAIERSAGRSPFGYRLLSGRALDRWIAGAEPFTDDAPEDSHIPTGRTWFG